MSGLRPFALHRPGSVAEASCLLADHGDDALVYAGGTELLVLLKAGLARRRDEQAAELARAEGERRLEQRARQRLVALGIAVAVLVGGTGLGVWAGWFSSTARVALIHGGVGEIDALGEAGFDRAVSEFGLVGEDWVVGTDGSGWTDDIRRAAASGADLIYVATADVDASPIIRDFPNTKFFWPSRVDGEPNSAYGVFAEHEGSFLAGVAAALKSRTGKIGFIGGHDDGFIWTWHAGYEAGPGAIWFYKADLDPAVTVERVTRTDARVIACGHTHVADVRELGQKLICNPGSCGYAFDGDPAACWALVTFDDDGEPTAELRRTAYDAQAAADTRRPAAGARSQPPAVPRCAAHRCGRSSAAG